MAQLVETHLAMAERHVRQGEIRLHRQLELIATVTASGNPDLVEKARDFLKRMEAWQRIAVDHLNHEREKQDDNTGSEPVWRQPEG